MPSFDHSRIYGTTVYGLALYAGGALSETEPPVSPSAPQDVLCGGVDIWRFSRFWCINTEAKSGVAHSGRTVSGYFTNAAVFVKIGRIDYSSRLIKDSLQIDELTTTQGATANFTVYGTSINKPSVGAEVEVDYSTNTNAIYKGQILTVKTIRANKGDASLANLFYYELQCSNYLGLLDRKLVRKSYTTMTVSAIIYDIITNFAPGFTMVSLVSVVNDVTIPFWYVDNESVGQAIKKLCEAAYLFWYITADKKVRILSKDSTLATQVISDGDLTYDELVIEEDFSQVRNRVYVRGAQKLNGTNIVETYPSVAKTDGTTTQKWTLAYAPVNLTISVESIGSVAIGSENLDSETGKDFMFNYANKTVRYSATRGAIAAGKTVTFTYQYYLPTLVVVENVTAQADAYAREGNDNSGGSNLSIHEMLVTDTSLENVDSALQRGKAELEQFSYPVIRGSFKTHKYNFRLGDYLSINLSDRTPLAVFIYQRKTYMLASQRIGYEIGFTDTHRDLYVDLMQRIFKGTSKTNTQQTPTQESVEAPIGDNF